MIESLRDMWPELKIVHGKPRHSQSQGSVERANQDMENMLTTWMQQNGTNKWSKGLQFVQFMKNSAYHSGIKRTPYKAMFGVEQKVGLTTSSLAKELIGSLRDEEDLNSLLQSMEKDSEELNIEDTDMESIANENDDNTELREEIVEKKCVICLENCSESYTVCTDCLKPAHFKCAIEVANEHIDGMDRNWRCIICARKTSIVTERNAAKEGLCQQAKRMKVTSDKKHPPTAIASTVRVKVPDVDRGRGDHRSILAIVLDVTENNFYKLGTRNGIIKQLYARSQFSVCNENILSTEEIPSKEISLRSVVTAQSTGTGQGFAKCACITKCETKKCFCKKNNLLCNSKCHGSGSCTNK